MLKKVVKRDGFVVDFDKSKIAAAINRAMSRTEAGVDTAVTDSITDYVLNRPQEQLSVEDIQNIVETRLMSSSRKDAAKAYIQYRQRRDVARQSKTKDIFTEIINTKANDVTRENANMNADTPAGMMMKFASETTKPFVDNFLLCDDVRNAVQNNYIHIHDKDYYPTKSLTCLQHPLDYIYENGFKAGHGESRPPKRIETASIQACISMETVQNEMHGGQAIPAFDFYLAPFVRRTYIEELKKIEVLEDTDLSALYDKHFDDYEKKDVSQKYAKFATKEDRYVQIAVNNTVERVHQSMEAFIHNMNTIHSRGGNQVVFSSINYGTDTSAEGRCIIREILNTTYEGVGGGSTAIFPIQIWKLKKGVSYLPEDRNYDLYCEACKVTARRFFPNFLNLDATFNRCDAWKADDPKRYIHEVATMGCRTRIWSDRFGESTSIGRGNLSFTTINFPKIAIESAIEAKVLNYCKYGDNVRYESIYDPESPESKISDAEKQKRSKDALKLFYQKFEEILLLCAKQLDERYKFQATAKKKQFPMLMSGLWMGSEKLSPDDTVESVIKHGTLAIGFIGLAEALVAMTGKHHGESDASQKEGLKIIKYMDKRIKDFSEIYDHNYSCFATPAEGLSGKFTKVDRKEFGIIKGVTDRDYYTNSNHVPVYYKCSAKHKAEVEGPYHEFTGAGHIFYVEIDGDATKNPQAVMNIVDLMTKNNMGYGSINHNRARCEDCGYESADEFKDGVCPKCGSTNTTFLQRITGYLVGTVERWNSAKRAELKDRVHHTL